MAVLVASDYEQDTTQYEQNLAVTVGLGTQKILQFTVLVAPESYVDYSTTTSLGWIT